MAKLKHTADEVIEAIRDSGGIKLTIARRLGVHRNSVDNYLERFTTAQQAYDDEVESIGDMAESNIVQAIKDKDLETSKWYAKAKLKNRGYSDSVQVEHSGEVNVIIDK